jgi:hypothetical protein
LLHAHLEPVEETAQPAGGGTGMAVTTRAVAGLGIGSGSRGGEGTAGTGIVSASFSVAAPKLMLGAGGAAVVDRAAAMSGLVIVPRAGVLDIIGIGMATADASSPAGATVAGRGMASFG